MFCLQCRKGYMFCININKCVHRKIMNECIKACWLGLVRTAQHQVCGRFWSEIFQPFVLAQIAERIPAVQAEIFIYLFWKSLFSFSFFLVSSAGILIAVPGFHLADLSEGKLCTSSPQQCRQFLFSLQIKLFIHAVGFKHQSSKASRIIAKWQWAPNIDRPNKTVRKELQQSFYIIAYCIYSTVRKNYATNLFNNQLGKKMQLEIRSIAKLLCIQEAPSVVTTSQEFFLPFLFRSRLIMAW